MDKIKEDAIIAYLEKLAVTQEVIDAVIIEELEFERRTAE